MGVPFMGKLPAIIQDATQLAFVYLDIVIAKNLYHISLAKGQFLYIQNGHHLHEQFSQITLRPVAACSDYPVQGGCVQIIRTEPHPAAPFR